MTWPRLREVRGQAPEDAAFAVQRLVQQFADGARCSPPSALLAVVLLRPRRAKQTEDLGEELAEVGAEAA